MLQVVKKGKAIRKVIARCKTEDWLISKLRVSPRHLQAPRINNLIENALKNYGLEKIYTFRSFFEMENENYRLRQQVGRYHINQALLNQIIAFKKDVDFEDIDESFIYKFAAYLRNDLKNCANTIKAKMTVLSTLFRKAIKAKLVKENPLIDINFKREQSIKAKLNVNELRLLMEADLPPKLAEVRDMFMACVYLRGLRIGDLLRLTADNVKEARITYVESKTGKQHSSAIIPELQIIIDRWRGKSRDGYIFSLLKVKESADPFAKHKAANRAVAIITSRLKRIAKQVGIDKNLTSHIARHSFAVLANQTIQNTTITKDLIGHATLAIHEAYITEVKDDIIMDGYANQVFNLLKH
nr:site-specific integrase [Pedobacter sp. Leaf170]